MQSVVLLSVVQIIQAEIKITENVVVVERLCVERIEWSFVLRVRFYVLM